MKHSNHIVEIPTLVLTFAAILCAPTISSAASTPRPTAPSSAYKSNGSVAAGIGSMGTGKATIQPGSMGTGKAATAKPGSMGTG